MKIGKKTWQEFKFVDIFNISRGKRLVSTDQISGEMPYISSTIRGSKESFTKNEIFRGEFLYVTTSNKNNGVSGTSNIFTEAGNVITIDSATDGRAFYQEFKFVGSDHVEVLEPINFSLNKYTALYFTSVLNLQVFRYSFGRKRSQSRIRQEKLFLPVNVHDRPDLVLMEEYIKSFPYCSDLE